MVVHQSLDADLSSGASTRSVYRQRLAKCCLKHARQLYRKRGADEYDISRLIAEVFPVEVQELFLKHKDAFAGRGVTELTRVLTMN